MNDRGTSFENDRKWCPECETYVPFLLSVNQSYCVDCGGEVRLFSKADWESFAETMSARRPQRGKRRSGASRRRDSA